MSSERRVSVLVIDDQQDLLDLLTEVVSSFGHPARAAKTVAEGIACSRSFLPDVVLCDLNIGGAMSGLSVARQFRSHEPTAGAELVAMTGLELDCCELQARAAGFDRVLLKPISLAQIEEILDRAAEAWVTPAAHAGGRRA